MKIEKWTINTTYVMYVVISIFIVLTIFIFKNEIHFKDISKVSYRNRYYLYSKNQIDKSNLTMFDGFQQTKPTGIIIKGMEVYDIDSNSQCLSPVIFLKTKDNKFLIYLLSGITSGGS